MIVPMLKGGIANQMFAIAAGLSVSLDAKTDLCINYNLPHACGQGKSPVIYKNNFFKKIKETTSLPTYRYNEPDWSYSPIPIKEDMLIDGYFQSFKHFSKYEKHVKDLFVFPDHIAAKTTKGLNNLKKKTIGIHVRLGDYLLPGYISTHLVCNRDYYIRALQCFENLDDYQIIVCTDNINDYNKYIKIDNAIICNGADELEDMYVLSQCDNLIISNSSFSWWSAFLGTEKKKIIAPDTWFGCDGPKNFSDIYMDNWIKIKTTL